jgi:hypothetical protein
MRRAGFLLIVAALWVAPVFGGTNPDDIEFKIKFVEKKSFFNVGEPIGIEISSSTTAEKKYRGGWTTPMPGLVSVIPKVTPTEGAIDLESVRDYMRLPGSILSSIGFLGSQPVIQRLDLEDWYRFEKPGHYSVSVQSNELSMAKPAKDGGGWELFPLESNILEFDIVNDPSWRASEVEEIARALKNKDETEQERALHRLILLDTPQSVKKLVQLYLSKTELNESSRTVAYRGLRESFQLDVIIPLLEAALSDPQVEVREGMTDLLASLQVRKNLGVLPPRTEDPAGQQEWNERYNTRTAALQRYLAKADALVVDTVGRRTGPERAAAIYQVWFTAERLNASGPVAPEKLSRLRDEVLSVGRDLASGQQIQVLAALWLAEPHWRLKPLVLSMVENRNKPDNFSLDEAYKFWCEGWPSECGAIILAEAIQPGTTTSKNAVFLLSESEHAELDEVLTARLRDPRTMQDSWESQRIAAIILRAGSRKLRPAVDEFLDKYVAQPNYGCEIESYLIGYLFRSAPADAKQRFMQETSSTHACASQLLRTLNTVRYSDELNPLAIVALDSSNLSSAAMAAIFLGVRGPATAQSALWRRLEKLQEDWRERTAELRGANTVGLQIDARTQAAQLEQALASALVAGANWKLAARDVEHLRASCLTQGCHDATEGNVSLGL